MKAVDILEWVMGWPWPILLVFGSLMAWGIARVITWDVRYRLEEPSSGLILDKQCDCQRDQRREGAGKVFLSGRSG